MRFWQIEYFKHFGMGVLSTVTLISCRYSNSSDTSETNSKDSFPIAEESPLSPAEEIIEHFRSALTNPNKYFSTSKTYTTENFTSTLTFTSTISSKINASLITVRAKKSELKSYSGAVFSFTTIDNEGKPLVFSGHQKRCGSNRPTIEEPPKVVYNAKQDLFLCPKGYSEIDVDLDAIEPSAK